MRVINTCRRMNIGTVAVYSSVDRDALHVRAADEAIFIGDPEPPRSYLDIDKIISAAKTTGTDAIHPGYGFLSENAQFAEVLEEYGITFIGPSSHAIEVMGSKLAAKTAVSPLGVPLVPGTDHAVTQMKEAIQEARRIGFPVLIKASAGGGGKGMRIVHSEDELKEGMERAQSEAQNAFGDSSVFIEKYIQRPRHIEVQVLFDSFGHGVYILDRECSIQRRHQKVIEEAPANDLPTDVKIAMGEAALNVGRSVNYVGAGTVEFLVDENHRFYFLEMNTRLQVEHPVSELVTGIDLVEWQIRIARGEQLTIKQEGIKPQGHAIELRIYAEDPANDFLPSIGQLNKFNISLGEGIRLDSGYETGQTIPIYYDPLLAKLISFGVDRSQAIHRLKRSILHSEIDGVATTLPFGRFVLDHPQFIEGKYSTHFVQQEFSAKELNKLQHDKVLVGQIARKILNRYIQKV